MAGNGTTYTIDIQAPTGNAAKAAAAVDALASRLETATTAAEESAAAVTAGEKAFAAAERAAAGAAVAVERIGQKIAALEGLDEASQRAAAALARVNVQADAARQKLALAEAAGDADAIAAANEKLNGVLERQVTAQAKATLAAQAAADAVPKIAALRDRHAEATAAAEKANSALAAEASTLDGLKGSAARAADAQVATAEAFGKAKKAAEEAAKASKKAEGSGEAQEALEGIAKLSGPLGGTVNKAKEAVEGFKKLSKSLGSAGTYVAIGAAMVAIATGLALVGAAAVAGVAKITWWAIELSDSQGVIKAEMKRLDTGFKKLFSGLKLDKFLSDFSSVVDLFDETNAAGKAIKVVFEDLFQPIVDGAGDMIAAARTAFLKFEIMALKALIAIKPYGSVILAVVKVLGIMAAVVGGVLLVAITAIAANLAIMATGIAIIITAVTAFVAGIVWLSLKLQELTTWIGTGIVDAFNAASAWLSSFSLADVGSNIITGLVNGIMTAGPAVLKALGGVVQGAVDGAKKLLGIASPSKVFAEIGGYTAEGMAVGVEAGAGNVQGALETMVSPPEVKAASAETGSRGGGGANLSGAVFNFYGVEGAEDARAKFEETLLRVLEGDAAKLGAA